eukprot:96653_1
MSISSCTKVPWIKEMISNPHKLNSRWIHVIYYPKRHSIIITNYSKLYEYTFDTSTWNVLAEFKMDKGQHYQFFDEQNDLLYLIRVNAMDSTNTSVLKYDLATRAMNHLTIDIGKADRISCIVFVPYRNVLHFFLSGMDEYDIAFDMQQLQTVSKLKMNTGYFTETSNGMLLIASNNRIYSVGSGSLNHVAYLDCNDEVAEWTYLGESPLSYRDERRNKNAILFDDIIVLFKYYERTIWCADLMDKIESSTNQWYKSQVQLPNCFSFTTSVPLVIADKNDFVHLIGLKLGWKDHFIKLKTKRMEIHFKTEIKKLIPNELKCNR